ncbi:MAG: ribonuclease E/G [bacterium]
MNTEIIINSSIGETRIAILEKNRLVELFVEQPENERMVGDIYLGKVVNVVHGMHAAFVDIGLKQDAFLHFSDIGNFLADYKSFVEMNGSPRRKKDRSRRPVPKEGQELLVQIIKEPINKKGARISTELSFPGRFLVLVPNSDVVGVSKKINSFNEKKKLKRISQEIQPKGFGLIVRTVAEKKDEKTLRADLESLLTSWNRLRQRIKKAKPPSLIYKDAGMVSSVIRDLFTNDVSRVLIDSKKFYREIITYLKDSAPSLAKKVEFYRSRKPIFDVFGIEKEIARSLSRKIWTPSGGYIIFDHTEALVAIDVNSGKYIGGREPEETTLRINLEAAKEVARQLRLRDIGGIIVIDFIDMLEPKNKKRLYDEFKNELRKDRATATIAQISEFGLIEMTRERIRPSLLHAFSEPCPTCDGIGRISSKNTVLTKIERWIKRFKTKRRDWSLILKVHPSIAEYLSRGLINRNRRLMWKYRLKFDVIEDDTCRTDQFRVLLKKDKTDITDEFWV